jgi:hypothetical protein
VRDKNGRIYVDLVDETINRLHKYYDTGEAGISPDNLYLCRSI